MKDFVDGSAFNNEQGNRARKLFAAVVLAALDDAIADDKKYGIIFWDFQEVEINGKSVSKVNN